MLHNRREMFVARHCGGFTWNGRYPWWNDNRRVRMTLGDSIVDSLTVIRAICRHRCNISIDLIKQVWNSGDIADIIRRQFHRDDFMRVGINT